MLTGDAHLIAEVAAWESDAVVELSSTRVRQTQYLPTVAARVAAARKLLPGGKVSSHSVPFDLQPWPHFAQAAFTRCGATGPRLSRGDVINFGGHDPTWSMFLLSFAWGWGDRSYAPARLERILGASTERNIREHLADAHRLLTTHGPVVAYQRLRAAIPHWKPAFFTKWLYFADLAAGGERALILDSRLARRVTQLTDATFTNLVDAKGKPWQWSAYRYDIYLRWMHATADALSSDGLHVPADLVEYALFRR